ncbi:SCO2522 family protein [Yinghuangia seranimata]|uniref:SCO2522 family protein n=1 Tax=Yinghuangia seranimata TaxID=408067 RepID=UPI00248ABC44|nr:SCO2522 family protein [Yinghuangia seranimata]MDI2129018.1 SCO2522 family protein [Yinghuangia seranimata]
MTGHDRGLWYSETSAEPRTESVPMSHLSVEVGHLYREDFASGPDVLRRQFRSVAAMLPAAAAVLSPPGRSRISTCFLVDDYFHRFAAPAEVVPLLVGAAAEAGLTIDYLARESACAVADGRPIAGMVAARMVAPPEEGGNGSRPPPQESGWLSNGTRSPSSAATEAMARHAAWTPPREFTARRHSIFTDVELWDDADGERTWSSPFLAAVWQLLRLGLIRDKGAAPLAPRPWDTGTYPQAWDDLPPLVQLNPHAAPFAAYRTFSVLPTTFLPIEHAVRVLLDATAVEPAVLDQLAQHSAAEHISLPREVTARIMYTFLPGLADGGSA